MSKYRLKLQNYKAIKSADIEFGGITVITGVNGTGKSTLSRILYYLINTMARFDECVFWDKRSEFFTIALNLSRVLSQIRPSIDALRRLREWPKIINNCFNFDELEVSYFNMIQDMENMLRIYFSMNTDDIAKKRILSHLEIDEDSSNDELSQKFFDKYRRIFDVSRLAALRMIDQKTVQNLQKYISNIGVDLDNSPINNMCLFEDDVNLLNNGSFVPPLSISNAIYIDTPMAINHNHNTSIRYWGILNNLMEQDAVEGSNEVKIIKRKIQKLLQGDVLVSKDEFMENHICYKRTDGLEIDLAQAATGFKSLAILFQLLNVGKLQPNTLLLIDEPEAHLHPQWIVEYANILVQLHKKIGVKIVIASHNPDMVSAIRAISEAQGTLDDTHFYLAEKSEAEEFYYNYHDLGSDIAPIFKSFNIALDRIKLYGPNESISEFNC